MSHLHKDLFTLSIHNFNTKNLKPKLYLLNDLKKLNYLIFMYQILNFEFKI